MKHQTSLTISFATIALLSGLSAAHAQKPDPAAVAEHVAAATVAAKSDLLGPLSLCKTATPTPGPGFMDNSDEAEHYIEGGLRKLGLDPADIKYVVISHAHGDHYGGAVYLKEKFNPRVVMSEIDWKALEETQRDPLFGTKRNPLFGDPPKRDMSVNDGDTIALGGTTLKLYVIPGHTLGTLATVFTVHDKGEAHRGVAWGGTAYNFGPLPDRLQLYSDTTKKYRDVLKQENADFFLSNHVGFDDSVKKIAALKDRKPGAPNPYVVGPDTVQRFLTILGECALATKASIGDDTPGK